jgi:hypothetical protein
MVDLKQRMTPAKFSIIKEIHQMKKLLLSSVLTVSTAAYAVTPLPATSAFTFIAPASVAVVPALTNLLDVVSAFKAVGSAFDLTDPNAAALLDQAALDMTLSIAIKNIDTAAINSPTYSPATGEITWVNNFETSLSSSSAWGQTDAGDYDANATLFRDAGAGYAVTAIMTGGSGVNHLLSAIDGTMRTVDGVDYTPTSSFNSYATGFNTAITLVDKVAYLGGAETALIAIQAQGLALDIAGAVAVTTLNTLVLPAAGMNSGSYSDLNSLLLYNGLR